MDNLLPAPTMLSVNLPFSGFYGSCWEHGYDSEMEQLVEHWQENAKYDTARLHDELPALAGRSHDEIKWDELHEPLFEVASYRTYMQIMAKEYANEFASWMADSLDLKDMAFEYEELTSPAYYNFETDRIFAKFSLSDLLTMRARLSEADEGMHDPEFTLAAAFKERFTSYDGFCSSYDNTIPVKPMDEWDHNELGTLVVAWFAQHEDGRRPDDVLYDWRCGGLYEEVYRAFSEAVDWEALKGKVAELVEEWDEDDADNGITREARTPRCPDTLDMPL